MIEQMANAIENFPIANHDYWSLGPNNFVTITLILNCESNPVTGQINTEEWSHRYILRLLFLLSIDSVSHLPMQLSISFVVFQARLPISFVICQVELLISFAICQVQVLIPFAICQVQLKNKIIVICGNPKSKLYLNINEFVLLKWYPCAETGQSSLD